MKRFGLVLPLALMLVAGCDGLKAAMSAQTSVAARAGSQELTTQRLADLIGNSTVPLQPEATQNVLMARAVADVWINYQLLAQAAARNDSLNDPKKMDAALWKQIEQVKIGKFAQEVAKTWSNPDTAVTEAEYNQGELLSAAHILFMFPTGGTPAQMDSVKKEAERVRKTVTLANFSDLVKKHSKDPGSVDKGGLYTAFPKGAMAKEFEDGVLALKPGEISGLVQTSYGYHIIRRPKYEEVRAEHGVAKAAMGSKTAESTFVAKIVEDGKVKDKKGATETVKKVVEDVDAHRNDKTVLVSSIAGNFTAGDFARLIRSFPNRQEILMQVKQMPDTVVPTMLKELARSQLLVRLADSAKIGPDSAELAAIRGGLTNVVVQSWMQLGVDPSTLGDSSANAAARSRTAATKIDAYMDGLMTQTRDFVSIPDPLEVLLRDKYKYSVSSPGLLRALEQATKVRAVADSVRELQMKMAPPTAVPMDRGGGAPPPSAPPGRGRGGN